MFNNVLRSFFRNDQGNIAVLTAVFGTFIIGTAGAAVDYARYTSYKEDLQSAADSAAIAGLQTYLSSSLTKKKGKSNSDDAAIDAVKRHVAIQMFRFKTYRTDLIG